MTPKKGPIIPGMKWGLLSPGSQTGSQTGSLVSLGVEHRGRVWTLWGGVQTQFLPHAEQLVGHHLPHVSVSAQSTHNADNSDL